MTSLCISVTLYLCVEKNKLSTKKHNFFQHRDTEGTEVYFFFAPGHAKYLNTGNSTGLVLTPF